MTKNGAEKYIADYHTELIESLKDDDEAEAYLQVALEEYDEDGDYEAFMLALKHLAEEKGGISELSKKTHLNRQNLYRVLSKTGNPRLDTLLNIIHALGFRFKIAKAKRIV
jgi:probable addiction module antidote protein